MIDKGLHSLAHQVHTNVCHEHIGIIIHCIHVYSLSAQGTDTDHDRQGRT